MTGPLGKAAPALPEMGEYQGKPIRLEEAVRTLSPDELAQVVVEVPGRGKTRPWRFAGDAAVDDDGIVIG